MNEIWKDIKGYEGLYQVSNTGRVKRVATGRVLKGSKNAGGYITVKLSKHGVTSTKTIHRLVAETFIPKPENKPEINHIDEDKTNNKVDNLEWSTRKENINHGTRTERMGKTRSISIIATNIKTGEVEEFYGTSECARQLGLNTPSITNVLKGRRETVGGYTFKYLNEGDNK